MNKTLGLIYGNLSMGGIQRGASFQIPMFNSWGLRVVLLTVQPPDDSEYAIPGVTARVCIGSDNADKRAALVERAVREYGIDLIIHHAVYSVEGPSADIRGADRAGCPVVIFWHSCFSHFYLRKHRQLLAADVYGICRKAAAMITLTKADEAFFRMLGVPALAIPYSDADLMDGFARQEHPRKVLWMGRFIELKRPLAAVRIFERVLKHFPDAEFYVLGASKEPQFEEDPRAYVSARPRLARAVHFEGFQKNVRPYLERCGVGLVTSRFEGYCHTIVEMKMASMPVVAFAMPYLDTLDSGSGAISVPQGDVDAAALAICRFFSDPADFRRQGDLARASYLDIASVDQRESYTRLFQLVAESRLDEFRALEPAYAHKVLETFVEHADWALELMGQTVDEDWQQNRSYRLGRIITWPYRRLKRLVRRILG